MKRGLSKQAAVEASPAKPSSCQFCCSRQPLLPSGARVGEVSAGCLSTLRDSQHAFADTRNNEVKAYSSEKLFLIQSRFPHISVKNWKRRKVKKKKKAPFEHPLEVGFVLVLVEMMTSVQCKYSCNASKNTGHVIDYEVVVT